MAAALPDGSGLSQKGKNKIKKNTQAQHEHYNKRAHYDNLAFKLSQSQFISIHPSNAWSKPRLELSTSVPTAAKGSTVNVVTDGSELCWQQEVYTTLSLGF